MGAEATAEVSTCFAATLALLLRTLAGNSQGNVSLNIVFSRVLRDPF